MADGRVVLGLLTVAVITKLLDRWDLTHARIVRYGGPMFRRALRDLTAVARTGRWQHP